ncbi:hypothetical protein RHGRI_026627 [Rhododendron griersonianum]|uniref:SET domain-containing protein n=1 Tax=Rhododendron griersonianum TaxID=479676 RepID=A0AAV6IVU0_9ERIC|nr:hypothetical protein RHGRI_026627 [Rhododendron griersonianum]
MNTIISSISPKMASIATSDLYSITSKTLSLTHFRPLTCAAAASSSPSSPARLVQHPPDLIKWVRKEGGIVHQSVKIAQVDPYGLGLVASDEIPKGSDLIALPHHVPLQFGSIETDGGDGAYSVLANLARQVPVSSHQVNKRCRFLLEFEKEVKQALENLKPDDHPFGGQDVDTSSLGWAMSAVSSRAFRLYGKELPDGTRINIPMMLPLIDMCNHSFSPNAEIIQEKVMGNPKMLVVAGTQIKQDEPLVLNYGCLNNDLFLLDYGFVVPSNPFDCIELKYDGGLLDAASSAAGVSSPNFSSPAPWQQQILYQLNLDGQAPLLKVSIGGPELVEGRLLAALRVLLSNDMERVHKHDLSALKSLSVEAPLGISTEVAALNTVIALCVIALGSFPTKIMVESLLKQNVSGSTELAVQFRIQKKSMIVDVMRDLTRRVRSLISKESDTSRS